MEEAKNVLAAGWAFEFPKTPPKATASFELLLSVFTRDNFSCRYCGTRTIFPGTMILLSKLLPNEFPCGPNWAWFDTHPAVRLYTATLDHVYPLVRGGSHHADNLVTACWKCNLSKGSYLLEELGWSLREPSEAPFDGYQGLFLEILDRYPEQKRNSRINRWHRTISQAKKR